MDFEKLLDQLKTFLEKEGINEDYAIFGSGPLAVRKLRQANDLDVIVKSSVFEKIKKNYIINEKGIISIGNIEIMNNWKPYFYEINSLIDNAETINEMRYVGLFEVFYWKSLSKRPKDQDDLKLIKKYIGSDNKKKL
jgi:hypothetical protein